MATSMESIQIVRTVMEYMTESRDAFRLRTRKSEQNWNVYHGIQDWSLKQPGQSTETLPMVSSAVEQYASFLKRALVDAGPWYDLEDLGDPEELIPRDIIKDLMDYCLNETQFATTVSDGIKVASLAALMVVKVHGGQEASSKFYVERGVEFTEVDENGKIIRRGKRDKLMKEDKKRWKLFIDLIRPQDFFPDPRGDGLYEIHRVNVDFHRVAKNPNYDPKVIELIEKGFEAWDERAKRARERGEASMPKVDFRRNVELLECWGDIIGDDGRVKEKNVVVTIANRTHLLRPPQPNPFFHQQSPFVKSPVMRVPFSEMGRALMDEPANINQTINEVLNLIIDGGMAEAWGIKQAHPDLMEDEGEIAQGIPYGTTVRAAPGVPSNTDIIRTVATGKLPQGIMALFNLLDRQFQQAAMVPDTKMGMLPPRQVKATRSYLMPEP